MAASGPRRGTAGTPGLPGVVAGLALRSARGGLAITQMQLAEHLGVDTDTIKGWETGRRALGNTKVATLRSVVHRLRLLGVEPKLLAQLELAIDVDLVVGQILADDGRGDPLDHPLATWVTTRQWTELLAPALSGSRPLLSQGSRTAFFAHLRDVAERSLASRSDVAAGVLLRRQAIYILAAWDASASEWIASMELRVLRTARHDDRWSPTWVGERSLAVAQAVAGDPAQLRSFITRRLTSADELETANLAYWAYWIGEGSGQATSDEFMATGGEEWTGNRLFRHLTDSLNATTPYLELSVHSLWALIERRPHLIHDDRAVAHELGARTARLLDDATSVDLGSRTVNELGQVHYATRMVRGNR